MGLHVLHDDVGLGQVGQDRLGEGARTADDGHGAVGPHGGDSLDIGQRPGRRRTEGEAERGLASVGRDEGRDRIEGDEAPVVDDGDPVAQGLGLLHVVGGQDHRLTALADVTHDVPHGQARLRVEGGGQLVEEEQLGIMNQGQGDEDTLALPTGEPGDVGLLLGGDAEALQQRAPGHGVVVEGGEELQGLADP